MDSSIDIGSLHLGSRFSHLESLRRFWSWETHTLVVKPSHWRPASPIGTRFATVVRPAPSVPWTARGPRRSQDGPSVVRRQKASIKHKGYASKIVFLSFFYMFFFFFLNVFLCVKHQKLRLTKHANQGIWTRFNMFICKLQNPEFGVLGWPTNHHTSQDFRATSNSMASN